MRAGIGRVRLLMVLFAVVVVGASYPGGQGDGTVVPGVRVATSRPVVPLRVMPLGASSTEGIGSLATAGYRGPLYRLLRRDAVAVDFVGSLSGGPASLPDRDHEGHSGWTLAMLAPRVIGWVRAARPDVVILHAGTNDLSAGASGAVVAQRLDDVLRKIYTAAPKAHVIVAGVWAPLPRARAARAELAARTPEVIRDQQLMGRWVTFVDTSDLLSPDMLADGLHPNAAGYARIARLLDTEIMNGLATQRTAAPAALPVIW